jgi:SAM-dependent methyltransferase
MAATGPVKMLAAAKVDLELASARRSTQAFYEDHAERYAQATLSQSMQPQLDRFLDIAPAGLILDLGCGAGRDLKALTQAGRPAMGLDLSWALARMARSFAASPVMVGDMRCPPVASASLAGVWASASLLHLTCDEVGRALGHIHRMLRPGGVAFSSIKAGFGGHLDADGRWFMLHDIGDWASLARDAGLQVLAIETQAGTRKSDGTTENWINCLAIRR